MSANQDRAGRAYRAVLYYQQYGTDADAIEASITDLITDLFHLADEYGLDQHELQLRALSHYQAEQSA